MHVSPTTLNRAANDAIPILFISAVASAATVGLYASAVVLSVILLQADFEIFGVVKTALILGTAVLAVGLVSLAFTVRRALQIGG